MYKKSKLVYIKAITPVHAGAGQTLETVDMPIQRETHSGIPKIEASSIKGSLKHQIYLKNTQNDNELEDNDDLYKVFGPKDKGDEYASAINFTDAKLLFFPVRSGDKIFRLVTCPYVLNRWIEDKEVNVKLNSKDHKQKEQEIEEIEKIESVKKEIKKIKNVTEGKFISLEDHSDSIIIEEYVFEKESNETLHKLKESLKDYADIERVTILNDSDFIDLVTMYTEIITRNKIDVKTGTAEGTALFTEEYLPTESILYFNVLASATFDKDHTKSEEEVMEYFDKNVNEVFHVGGNTTIGKGFVKIIKKEGV